MEGSPLINSMQGPYLSSQETTLIAHHEGEDEEVAEEESGWTTYLEDFSKYRSSSGLGRHSSFVSSSFGVGTSLVSDAASRYHDRPISGLGSPRDYLINQATGTKKPGLIKKMKAKAIAEEDPLEDTASSPVSSPTVLDDYKRLGMASRRADDFGPNFFGSGGGSSCHHHHHHHHHHHRHGLEMESMDGRNEVERRGQNSDSSTSLKDGGLCLVPLSMFSEYIG